MVVYTLQQITQLTRRATGSLFNEHGVIIDWESAVKEPEGIVTSSKLDYLLILKCNLF